MQSDNDNKYNKRPIRLLLFLTLFLGTPAATLLFVKPESWFPVLAGGALASGIALAAAQRKPGEPVILWGIIFGFGIAMVYVCIAFVGCMTVLSRIH